MSDSHAFQISSEADLALLAQILALKARPGDVIALEGDLGAGKTTFARAFIRAAIGDPETEVPSPTFPLLQVYETERFQIHHFDLYRLSEPDELVEIGFLEDPERTVSLIEWPGNAGPELPEDRIEISIAEVAGAPEARLVRIEADNDDNAARLARIEPLYALIKSTFATTPASELRLAYLQGDASARGYARLYGPFGCRIVMDSPAQPDGPPIRDGKPYSRLAHLAETITPFLAIGDTLRRAGFSTPACMNATPETGVAIFEDLGDCVFGSKAAAAFRQEDLWRAAVDTLLALHEADLPRVAVSDSGLSHTLPAYDQPALEIEIALLADWYVPWATGNVISHTDREALDALWHTALDDTLSGTETTWVLRDFHSPNLIWLPDRTPPRNVGLIDFQDALLGHPAYDLVSLLQDARLDVPEHLERDLLAYYIARSRQRRTDFDEASFRQAYALLGAQRNTKILGIFARLAMRDGKPGYLRHIPRIRRYLTRDLAHPALSALKQWYDTRIPSVT